MNHDEYNYEDDEPNEVINEYEEETNEELEEIIKDEEKSLVEKPATVNYVDKKRLYDAYVDWYAKCDVAKLEGKDRPEPHPYISYSIIAICKNLSSRWNFSGYPFRDEMVGDAIENLWRYADRVNLEKSDNVFGYMTKNAYWTMVRRIKDEKTKAATKHLLLMNSGVLENLNLNDADDALAYNSIVEQFQYAADTNLAEYLPVKKVKEKKVKRTRTRKNVNSIEDLLHE